ncbi:MAG TPA: hypothetical protein VF786_12745 [Terriglobales bacterium]
MKPKFALIVMFFVMLFSLAMVAQDSSAKPSDGKAACACCSHDGAAAADCCKDGKCCDMKDGKMDCGKDMAKAKSCCKKMAKGKSCCKDGKCEMAKGDKPCCGKSCKMSKAS